MKYLCLTLFFIGLTACKPQPKFTALCFTPLGIIQAQESDDVKVSINPGKTAVTVSDRNQQITIALSNCTLIRQ